MEQFIDVEGVGEVVEAVVEYSAEITLTVRAAHVDTAIAEVTELRAQCIRVLRESGLTDRQLTEGGAQVWRSWFWKAKKSEQDASQKLLVKCNDLPRLMGSLGSLEALFANQRYTLSVAMGQPRFETDEAAVRLAERAAIAQATKKAQNLAESCNLRLNGALEVEEIGSRVSRSGAYGDHEWFGAAA